MKQASIINTFRYIAKAVIFYSAPPPLSSSKLLSYPILLSKNFKINTSGKK